MADKETPTTNGWGEWSNHVLLELERLNKCFEKLDTNIQDLREDVVILKVKAGLWGAAAGVIVSIIVGLIIKAMGD